MADQETLQADCELKHLKHIRSSAAVALVRSACNFLSGWSATMELEKVERRYNECLLDELPGVLNDQAALLISQACRRKAYGR